ncbi:MAG: fibronectin type III domain-containing protein [Saprospiraceae bacterium]
MSKTIYLLLLALALSLGASAQQSPAFASAVGKPAAPAALHNIPDCTDPRDLTVSDVQGDGFRLTWAGKPAQAGVTEYVVRFRLRDGKSAVWTEQRVQQGTSAVVKCPGTGTCEVEVKKICFWRDGSELHSRWVPTEVELTANRIPLPPFTCGAAFTFPITPCDSLDLLGLTAQISVVYVGGIPIELDEITPPQDPPVEGQMYWSGSGVATLPFATSAVRVEFVRVRINADTNICDGTVFGLQDDPAYWPNLNPPPLAFGGAICVPPPSTPGFDSNGIHNVTGLPWDEHGFGPDGAYDKQPPYPGYQPGMPYDSTGTYDPNGFDKNGIHAQTGTKYNQGGCDREGLNAEGEPCDPTIEPYSWMNPNDPNPPTQAGLEYAGEIKDSIGGWIQNILNDLNDEYEIKRDSQQTVCDGIRDTMRTLVNGLGYAPEFIFGPDSIYFTVGMHQHFRTAPTKMLLDMVRNDTVKALENRHIDLYVCDKAQYAHQYFMDIIADFLGAGFNELKASMLDKVKSLPSAGIERFRNTPGAFLEWLEKEVRGAVGLEHASQHGGSGFVPFEETSPQRMGALDLRRGHVRPAPAAPSGGYGQALAADLGGELGHLLLAQAMEMRPEDIAFEYRQGFRMINGVHRALYMEAIAKARHMNAATAHDTLLMPIEITNRGNDGKRYSVYLDNIAFTPAGHTLDAYIVIETPFDGQKLVFEALDVAFTPAGPVVNPVKIRLANDVHIRINNNARFKLLGGDSTYVAFDCLGFAGIAVAAEVELCRNIVLPYHPPTDEILPAPRHVHGNIMTYMPSFSEFFLEFSMDPFAIPGYEDVKWMINGVALDMSESMSPNGAPPLGYSTPFAGPGGFAPAWKGFYMDSFIVRLPRAFSKDSTPVSVGVEQLVIDNMGVSGIVSASNILPLSEGSAGGWAFSIDQFDLTVIMNQFSGVAFGGKMHVPIFRAPGNNSGTLAPEDCMDYVAHIDPGNRYSFALKPLNSDYVVDIWKAGEVTIDSNSSVLVRYQSGVFTTTATLHGSVLVDGNLATGVDIEVPKISFQGVQLSNKAPYFSPGVWGFPNQIGAKFAGFELVFRNIGMVASDSFPALRFQALINIGDTTKIRAGGGFLVRGELADDNGRQRWVYHDFKVEEILISGSFPGIRNLHGYAGFYYNNASYGTGFRGELAAELEMIDASVQVVGQFGRMPAGYKYFMVDALYCGNVPMAGALSIKGLGGGVYYHMNRPDSLYGLPQCAGGPGIPAQIGASLSGIVYTPDASKSLGFKFTVAVALSASDRAFNGNATYEVLFNSGGGLEKMWLYGNARFMSGFNVHALPTYSPGSPPSNGASVAANFQMSVQFGSAPAFQGSLAVYANIANVLRGSGDGNKVVDASVYFGPGKWHIKIGSPSKRAGLTFTLPLFGDVAKVQSYFQIGTDIEDIPPLPDEIANLTGAQGLSPGERLPDVDVGEGFSFGADLQLGSKEYTFLFLYAGLYARLGFDISVLDYDTSAVCSGKSEPIGINGWYASGQIYGMLHGSVGIKVKVFGFTVRINFLSLSAAAALEAKLPNPFWARASVGMSYSVLGGAVEGNINFKVEIGEKCQIQGQDPFKGVPIILDTYPLNGAVDVPVNAIPAVFFNFLIEKKFKFTDLNDKTTEYLIKVDSAKLIWHGHTLPVTWGIGEKSLRLNTDYFLPGFDTFTMIIKVHVDSNGVTVDHEERIVTFTTGAKLDIIPPDNVKGSYPLDGQYNFYKEQIATNRGYIQLKRGQPDVFFDQENYVKVLRFRESGTGDCHYQLVNVESENYWDKRLEFEIPTEFIENWKTYEMQLVEFPVADPDWGSGFAGPSPCEAAPAPAKSNPLPASGDGRPLTMPGAPPPVEKVLYSAYFRASMYNTFMEKVQAIEENQTSYSSLTSDPMSTAARLIPGDNNKREFWVLTNVEPFDTYEALYGGAYLQNVIHGSTDNWYVKLPGNFIYGGYFPDASVGVTAEPSFNNVFESIRVNWSEAPPKVTKENYLTGLYPPSYATIQSKIYFFGPKVVENDLNAVVNQANAYMYENHEQILYDLDHQYGMCDGVSITTCIGRYCGTATQGYSEGFKKAVSSCGLTAPTGTIIYPVKFQYRMPGWDQITTSRTINLIPPP